MQRTALISTASEDSVSFPSNRRLLMVLTGLSSTLSLTLLCDESLLEDGVQTTCWTSAVVDPYSQVRRGKLDRWFQPSKRQSEASSHLADSSHRPDGRRGAAAPCL